MDETNIIGNKPAGADQAVKKGARSLPVANDKVRPSKTSIIVDSKVLESWSFYKEKMITSDGMPLMVKGENRTTSEAVSYVMLQAVLLDDMETFDKVFKWAKSAMQRADGLFGWEWKEGRFTQYGGDSASDGDQDIAASLILAYKKTGDRVYSKEAQRILDAVWKKDVVKLRSGALVITAGDKQALYLKPVFGSGRVYGVNPSYFRPTYYSKLYAEFDTSHPWKELVGTSYKYIELAADSTMHGPKLNSDNIDAAEIKGTKNLTPDFIAVRDDGSVTDHEWNKTQDYCYGGDAGRIPFWICLQAKVDPSDKFAKRFISEKTGTIDDAGPLAFLVEQVNSEEGLLSGYQINGEPIYDFKGLRQGEKWAWRQRLWSLAVACRYFTEAGEADAAQKAALRIEERFTYKSGEWKENDPYDKGAYYYGQSWMRFSLLFDAFAAAVTDGNVQGLKQPLNDDTGKPASLADAEKNRSSKILGIPLTGIIAIAFNGATGRKTGQNSVSFKGKGYDDGMVLFEGINKLSGKKLTFLCTGKGTLKIVFIKSSGRSENNTGVETIDINWDGQKSITLPVPEGTNKVNIMAAGEEVEVNASGFSVIE